MRRRAGHCQSRTRSSRTSAGTPQTRRAAFRGPRDRPLRPLARGALEAHVRAAPPRLEEDDRSQVFCERPVRRTAEEIVVDALSMPFEEKTEGVGLTVDRTSPQVTIGRLPIDRLCPRAGKSCRLYGGDGGELRPKRPRCGRRPSASVAAFRPSSRATTALRSFRAERNGRDGRYRRKEPGLANFPW
jgi:hypothetical protein